MVNKFLSIVIALIVIMYSKAALGSAATAAQTRQEMTNELGIISDYNIVTERLRALRAKKIKPIEDLGLRHNIHNGTILTQAGGNIEVIAPSQILTRKPSRQEVLFVLHRRYNSLFNLDNIADELLREENNENLILNQLGEINIVEGSNRLLDRANNSYQDYLYYPLTGEEEANFVTEEYISEIIDEYLKHITSTQDVVKHAKIQTSQPLVIHEILDPMIKATDFRIVTPMVGVAAGNDEEVPITYGLWSSGFLTNGKQGGDVPEARYKINQKGIVFGTDILVKEDSLIGIAYSNSVLVRKYNVNEVISDRKTIYSHIFSVYGSYKFNQTPIYISGQTQFGKINLSSLRNEEEVLINSGKSYGYIYGAKCELGSNLSYNNIYIIPKIGISYYVNNLKAFKETGQDFSFLFHNNFKATRLSGNLGVELRKKIYFKNYILVPSIYFSMEKILRHKNNMITISNADAGISNLPLTSSANNNVNLMIGAKASIYHNSNLEVDFGYDMLSRSQFISHTSTVKFKINF